MFKSARWRNDMNKITALFKLRFHATQVSQLEGNELVLSLVPADTGRPTAKLENSEIRDGCCYWNNPIFETVKLIQDLKSGEIHERIFYFIISTGSSKLSILGEVSVNIAEYAGATKATSVALPFKGSISDVVLHVLIQRIQENICQRELEEHEGAKEDRCLKRYFSNIDAEETISVNSTEEEPLRKTVSNIAELNGNRRASIGSDITLSSSDSSSGLNTPRELGAKSNNMHLDSVIHNQQKTQWKLSLVPTHHSSTDDSTKRPRAAFPNGRSQLPLDDSVQKLKSELALLSRKAEVADLELQTLRKQIVKESKRGQDLLQEVASLKEEKDALKEECEELKASQKIINELKAKDNLNDEGDPLALLEEMRQELNHEKDLNVNLRLQLQKTQESNSELILAVQDLEQMLEQSKRGNFDLSAKPLAGRIQEILGERGLEVHDLSDVDEEQNALEEIVKQHTGAKEAYILEQKIIDLCSEIEMYRRDKDEIEMQMEQLALDYEILKQENHDMSCKLDQSHMQEQLKVQYECSSSYGIINELQNRIQKLERELKEQANQFSESLATIKELENHICNLKGELEKQAQGFKDELEVVTRAKMAIGQQAIQAQEALRLAELEFRNQMEKLEGVLTKKSEEYSDALATIMELEDQLQRLEEELDKQAQGFESDLEAVTHGKVEQEQRAIRAEEALRLAKWKNANTAERLQDQFRRLSIQMQSTFEANEKVATKAMTEASELRLINNHLEELLQQAKEELQSVKDDHGVQVNDLQSQLSLKSKQIDQMSLDIEEKFKQLNHQKEHENEICHSLLAELLKHRAEMDRLTSDTAPLTAQMEHGVVASANNEAEKSSEELNAIRCLKNEKDISLPNLQSDVDTLRAHCEELRHSFHDDELEKENLRKEVVLLKAEIKKKDDSLTSMERKLKDDNEQAMAPEGTALKEVKLLEGQIKQRETALEVSANAFLEKEKDHRNKIEESEKRLEEHNQSIPTLYKHESGKIDGNAGEFELIDDSHKLVDNVFETSVNRIKENGIQLSASTISSGSQHDVYAFLMEMASLRKKNASVENELKEMQERYSEISLKFAEVEGERQQLIMNLRNMNANKS